MKCKVKEPNLSFKKIKDMEPGEIGIIVMSEIVDCETLRKYVGEVVMRTTSRVDFCVMGLSNIREGFFWDHKCDLEVRIFQPGTIIEITI